jgi:hypothetical protein
MADRLIPPIVPSAVRAETAKNILCGVNKAWGRDAHQWNVTM